MLRSDRPEQDDQKPRVLLPREAADHHQADVCGFEAQLCARRRYLKGSDLQKWPGVNSRVNRRPARPGRVKSDVDLLPERIGNRDNGVYVLKQDSIESPLQRMVEPWPNRADLCVDIAARTPEWLRRDRVLESPPSMRVDDVRPESPQRTHQPGEGMISSKTRDHWGVR